MATNITELVEQNLLVFRHKGDLVRSDRVKPTAWEHGTHVVRSEKRREQWTYKGRYRKGALVFEITQTLNDTAPEYPRNLLALGGMPLDLGANPISSRVRHGSYLRSNTAALKNLHGTSMDVGSFVAEFSESATYFARYALSMMRVVHAIRWGEWDKALKICGITRKNWNKVELKLLKRLPSLAKDAAGMASQRYLEWQFAIQPLVISAAEANDFFNRKVFELDHKTIVSRGKYIHQVKHDDGDPWGRKTEGAQYFYTRDYTQVTRTCIYARITDMEAVVQKATGLESYIHGVYEILPWSWLIDYCVDIGSFFEASRAHVGLGFVNGYNSTRTYGKQSVVKYDSSYSGAFTGPAAVGWRYYQKSRVVMNGYVRHPLDSFPVVLPTFVLLDNSVAHVSNVIALAGSILSGRKSNRF